MVKHLKELQTKSNIERYIGIYFICLITVILGILKMANIINISWIWVISPFWIILCIGGIVIILAIIFELICFILSNKDKYGN